MKVYKLTDQNRMTYNNTLWGENVTHETSGEGELCSEGWLHYYHHPLLALLLNSIHANIKNPILWEAEAEGKQLNDRGLKGGCTKLTTIRQLPLPEITLEQRIEFAIRCTMEVYKEEKWLTWAEKWLSGEDQSQESANDAAANANAVNDAAADADAAYYTAAAYDADPAKAAYVAAYTANATSYVTAVTEIHFDIILKQVFG